jgi:hypothetical protein
MLKWIMALRDAWGLAVWIATVVAEAEEPRR